MSKILLFFIKNILILLCSKLIKDHTHTKDNKDLRGSANDAYVHGEKSQIHYSNEWITTEETRSLNSHLLSQSLSVLLLNLTSQQSALSPQHNARRKSKHPTIPYRPREEGGGLLPEYLIIILIYLG